MGIIKYKSRLKSLECLSLNYAQFWYCHSSFRKYKFNAYLLKVMPIISGKFNNFLKPFVNNRIAEIQNRFIRGANWAHIREYPADLVPQGLSSRALIVQTYGGTGKNGWRNIRSTHDLPEKCDFSFSVTIANEIFPTERFSD